MKGSDVASARLRPELIERVESGEGADRELDGDILDALHDPSADKTWPFVEGSYAASITPRITSSLDAVVSLLDQKLPGWSWSLGQMRGRPERYRYRGFLSDHNTSDGIAVRYIEAECPTPARALLAACLRAIQAQARTLADAHSKSPSRPAMPKEEDTHG